MSTELKAVLEGIVRRHGSTILTERARLFALLRDYAPDDLRGVRVLMTAYDSGAPERLKEPNGGISRAALESETARLVDLFAVKPELARAAVETWAAFLSRDARGGGVRPLPLPGAPDGTVSSPWDLQGKTGVVRWLLVVAGLLVKLATALRKRGRA